MYIEDAKMNPGKRSEKSRPDLAAVGIYSEQRLDGFACGDMLPPDETAGAKTLLDRFNRRVGRRTENLPSGM